MSEVSVDTRCMHVYPNGTRCKEEGNPCWLPNWRDDAGFDEPHEYLCGKHMFHSGYCPGCGLFWGGIESFDFSPYRLCENCASEMQAEEEEDNDDWPGGYLP